MINSLNKCTTIFLLMSFLFAQDSLIQDSSEFQNEIPLNQNGADYAETSNRLPLLLKDVKVLLTDAIIAHSQADT